VLAYLDANSGSMIAAAVAAGGAGVAVAARMGLAKVKKPFSRKRGDETTDAAGATDAAEPVAEDA
jgi:hypothetical protein